MELLSKISRIHTIDKCSVMHLFLTYKLATKPLEIKKTNSKKGTNISKAQKNYKKDQIFYIKIEKSHKYVQKDIRLPTLTPKSHNVLIGRQGATTNNRFTKKHKKNTYIHKLTHKPKTEPHLIDNKITHK